MPDEGALRISRAGPAGEVTVVAAHLGQDGVYRDEAGVRTGAEATSEAKRDEPKFCPAPNEDNPGGRKAFDILYQQHVRDIVNPQRLPQLSPCLAFSPVNPSTGEPVSYDDCRESDGAMIEAKGHYEEMMGSKWGRDKLEVDWREQAQR